MASIVWRQTHTIIRDVSIYNWHVLAKSRTERSLYIRLQCPRDYQEIVTRSHSKRKERSRPIRSAKQKQSLKRKWPRRRRWATYHLVPLWGICWGCWCWRWKLGVSTRVVGRNQGIQAAVVAANSCEAVTSCRLSRSSDYNTDAERYSGKWPD